MGGQGPGQLAGKLALGDDHPVSAQLFQHPAMGLVMGLADHIGNPQFLQIHHRQHRGCQIVTNGHDGAVKIAGAQGPKDFLVLSVTGDSMGHMICHLLHQVFLDIHRQDLATQLAELPGGFRSEQA